MFKMIENKLIGDLKREKEQISPENLDFGYCIPDCGNCCKVSLETAMRVSKEAKIDLSSVVTEFLEDKHNCVFMCDYSVCILHDNGADTDLRPYFCGGFECSPYHFIKKINEAGYDLTGELKSLWLQRLNNGYDQEEWKRFALNHMIDLHKKIFQQKITWVDLP